mmetsp:Transcript_6841/g.20284  ORF Transcript_6841/g.20284 Transcript_6841/m.20284 type:complete len:91 (-) Transcript_6841:131-403(-)
MAFLRGFGSLLRIDASSAAAVGVAFADLLAAVSLEAGATAPPCWTGGLSAALVVVLGEVLPSATTDNGARRGVGRSGTECELDGGGSPPL